MVRNELNVFERIFTSLQEAALDPDFWPSVSALIEEALGTHGSALACGDGESEEGYRTYVWRTCLHGQQRSVLHHLRLEIHYSLDEWTPRLRHLTSHIRQTGNGSSSNCFAT